MQQQGDDKVGLSISSFIKPVERNFDAELACAAAFVVGKIMLNGYVGIVSRRGLCQIQIERQDTLRHARQAGADGNKQPRVGFWAILSSDLAHQISTLVEQGEGREALRVLNQVVREGGHLFPLNR